VKKPIDWRKIVVPCREGTRVQVKVTPGSSRTKLLGLHGESLKIAVAAPPEKGKANVALIKFLAEITNLSKQQITLASGETNPEKVLVLSGINPQSCIELFKAQLESKKK
jgi:uncharacterized protein (TIGR00251 family)